MVVPTPSLPLPLGHPEAVPIGPKFSMESRNGTTTYFLYLEPIYEHADNDRFARRLIAVQLAQRPGLTQAAVARALDVSPVTVNRWMQIYRESGAAGLEMARAPRARTALDAEQQRRAAELRAQGQSLRAVALELDVNRETLRQYERTGCLRLPEAAEESAEEPRLESAEEPPAGVAPDAVVASAEEPEAAEEPAVRVAEEASEEPAAAVAGALERTARDARDAAATMGRAARDVAGRVAASLGWGAPRVPRFEHLAAVPWGGLLTMLPALLQQGLLRHGELLPTLRRGFYSAADVFLLLAFLLLARQRSAQSLATQAPGEWGAVLGLDRAPDVKTFRAKLHDLAADGAAVQAWHAALAADWMQEDPEVAATVCFDGHVQTYSGQGHLPRHFVSRQKLCLPAAASYWMNALGGQPFLCLHVDVDRGLQQALRDDLLPELRRQGRLDAEGPDLTQWQGAEPRLTVVFDREGWSPQLFAELARQGVACLTWRKGRSEPWPRSWFAAHDVRVAVPGGQRHASVLLAERRLQLPAGRFGTLELREIRRLDARGGQVALVTTHPRWSTAAAAGAMLSRWSHENYFRLMKQDFGLDRMPEYVVEPLDPETAVPNPERRGLERLINDLDGTVVRRHEQARKARAEGDSATAEQREAEASLLAAAAAAARGQRWRFPSHVPAAELAPGDRLDRLARPLRLLYATVRMLAYRAETQLLGAVGPDGGRGRRPQPTPHRHPRQVLQALYATPATLRPDAPRGLLRVELLHLANPALDRAVAPLLERLNKTATRFPGTTLQLHYSLGPAALPPA